MLGRAVIGNTRFSSVGRGIFGRSIMQVSSGSTDNSGLLGNKEKGATNGSYKRIGNNADASSTCNTYGSTTKATIGSAGSAGGATAIDDVEIGIKQAKRNVRNPPEAPKDKYGVGDAYKWLYGALSRQPASNGLPATALALAAISGEGLLASQPAVLLGKIVDVIGENDAAHAVETAWPLFGLIALSLVGKEAFTISRKYIIERQSTALEKGAFLEQARHLLAVRVDALQDRRVGDLAVRLDKSVAGLIKLVKVTFLEGMPNLATACVALTIAYNAHWSVGMAMIGAVSAGGLVTTLQIQSQEGIRISLNEQKAAMGGSIAEMLGNLAYIRASGMRPAEERRLEAGAEALRRTEFTHHKYMMSFGGAKDLIEGLGFTVVVGVAIGLALKGEISSGDILTLSMLYMKAAQPLSKMHAVFDGMHEAVIKIGALSAVRGLPSDPGLNGTLGVKAGMNVLPMEAKDLGVSLSRGGGGVAQSRVLDSLSLDLQRGTVVGLAGTSGSGKSTLLKVALGLIPDYDGSMKMFGTEIRDLQKLDLSVHVAYAQQEPFVLTGTLRENLLLAQPSGLEDVLAIDDETMFRALNRSCLGPDDYDWAHGLDTHIHEGGRNLSGGQRQRLALARIFLQRNAELIVLDEATSALDNATESRVIEELHAHAAEEGRTVIMVAHRLTTLRNADRVLVMDEGKVVQDGSYADLSQNPGIFFDLLQYNNKGI
mmetsp:Transcript_19340/g.42075  ORF Transcript_19340/g.42075 Transcript_19340/m.42075 type:complete len:713 (+) Transcript_19340:219-2357(+)